MSSPAIASPVIDEWAVRMLEFMPDRNVAMLNAMLGDLAGCNVTDQLEAERLEVVVDWMWHRAMPLGLDAADEAGYGPEWTRMLDGSGARSAIPAIRAIADRTALDVQTAEQLRAAVTDGASDALCAAFFASAATMLEECEPSADDRLLAVRAAVRAVRHVTAMACLANGSDRVWRVLDATGLVAIFRAVDTESVIKSALRGDRASLLREEG